MDDLLLGFQLRLLFLELEQEATARPAWLKVPLHGILELFADRGA